MGKPYLVRPYAELQAASHFSFLRGASDPRELVLRAAELGLAAIAITDRNTLAGVVRAYLAAKEMKKAGRAIRLIVGARLDFTDGPSVLALPADRQAYGHLSHLLTVGKRRAPKGQCHLQFSDLLNLERGQKLIVVPPERLDAAFAAQVRSLGVQFPRATYLAIHKHYGAQDRRRLKRLEAIAEATRVPLVVTNDVHAHVAERRALQDVMTCIREGCRLDEAGFRLHANGERHLKSPQEMSRLFQRYPDALDRTVRIAEECTFSLKELKYEYPDEPVPEGRTPQEHLKELTWDCTKEKYPNGIPEKVRDTLEKELVLIEKLDYARYFLTIREIVEVAREKKILCQGRGSAANSAVCYVLGITAVDPDKIEVLFDRFMSLDRDEPPDIDVDFEHERREEIIQWVYERYGRDRAGIVATTITYRSKSAMRDVAKAFGLSDRLTVLTRELQRRARDEDTDELVVDPKGDPRTEQALALADTLRGFPRHLSQHTGGFVITKGPLSHVVPIENAVMENRTVIEWNKDDLDALGMLKIDVLALGMLTCLRKGLDLIKTHYGRTVQLGQITQGSESGIYEMLSQADTVGLFQVESRAQMSMLPRLKPKEFYDLVIEVAIVRPGPIQGDMVHPYLRRRDKKEPVVMPSPALYEVLKRTCGVPLFQEQAMKIAMVAAGFTSEEANQLRSAMATFRHRGTIGNLETRFIDGMVRNGYERDFAERCFNQIKGFGDYGFPESHAASFALLVYASAWLKYHYPAVFTCAILNSQPMGFYQPAQLVRDAQDRGVEVRPVDVSHSDWDCTLEPKGEGRVALRLGMRMLKGLREDTARELMKARVSDDFTTLRRLWYANKLDTRAAELLGHGDAWNSLGLSRREALWAAKSLGSRPLPLFAPREEKADLRPMLLGEEVTEDYAHLGLSLKGHPMALLRPALEARGVMRNGLLSQMPNGSQLTLAGVVLIRQRPGTAKGVIFVTLEDETGVANLVLWPNVIEQFERVFMDSQVLEASGRVQRDDSGLVIHVVAERLSDRTDDLVQASRHATLIRPPNEDKPAGCRRMPRSRDFH